MRVAARSSSSSAEASNWAVIRFRNGVSGPAIGAQSSSSWVTSPSWSSPHEQAKVTLYTAGWVAPGRRSRTRNSDNGSCTSPRRGHGNVYRAVSPSYIRRLSIGTPDGKRNPTLCVSPLVLDQREDVVALEALASVQKLELDHEGQSDDLATELLDEIHLRSRRSASREQVVVDEDSLPRRDRVGVELQCVEAVLERVLDAHGPPGELARLAGRDEATVETVGERRPEDEPSGLGPEDQIGLARLGELRELLHRLVQPVGIGEQRHDVLEDDAALREVRDIPDLGGQVHRRSLAGHERAKRAPEEELRELLRERRERLEIFEPTLPSLRVPRAQGGSDDLLEQPGLAVRACSKAPEIARLDAVTGEAEASGDDVDVSFGIETCPVLDTRLEEPEILELPGELAARARTRAERLEVDLLLVRTQPASGGTLTVGRAKRRGQLLPDDAQREELVALQAQDHLQAVDVVIGKQAVPALRPPGRHQALILEVADLGDGDVGELGLEPPADCSDRQRTRVALVFLALDIRRDRRHLSTP